MTFCVYVIEFWNVSTYFCVYILFLGLFRRVIVASGTTLNLWGVSPPGWAKRRASVIFTIAGCAMEPKNMIQCLTKKYLLLYNSILINIILFILNTHKHTHIEHIEHGKNNDINSTLFHFRALHFTFSTQCLKYSKYITYVYRGSMI